MARPREGWSNDCWNAWNRFDVISLDPDHLLRLRGIADRNRAEKSVTSLPGGMVTRARGNGLEPAELRAFAPGDDPRHLDRNATARTGHPHVRMFHAERDRTTLLIADFRPSMLWGTRRTLRSVAAAEALAVAGWSAVLSGGRVGLIAVTASDEVLVPPRARDRAMVRVIGALATAHRSALADPAAAEPPLTDALSMANRIAPRGSEVVLASAMDHAGEAFREQMQGLASRTDVRIIRISDAFEMDPPSGRYRFATRDRPEGREGRPMAADQTDRTADGLNIPVEVWHSARAPEAQHHG